MKFDAHASQRGPHSVFDCKGNSRASESKAEFCPTFFYTHTQPIYARDRHSNRYMNNYLLLICISVLPAIAGIAVTRPLWKLKYLRNEDIHFISVAIMIAVIVSLLIYTVLQTAFTSAWIIGMLSAPASLINLLVYEYYDLRLHIRRCPYCHSKTLRIRSKKNGHHHLRCRNCGIRTEWKA